MSAGANTLGTLGHHAVSAKRKSEEAEQALRRRTRLAGPLTVGLATLVLGVGGFFLWAALTPISRAAIVSAKVIVEGKTKTVTNLEGGTLDRLLVEEGQNVKAGQPLLVLEMKRSLSQLFLLRQNLYSNQVTLARLLAERDGKGTFGAPPAAAGSVSPAFITTLVATERMLLAERNNLLRDQLAADRANIEQTVSQQKAFEARLASWLEQQTVMLRDLDAIATLEGQKLATTGALNEKKLQLLEMEARASETKSAIAAAVQRKAQLELGMASRRTDNLRDLTERIKVAQTEIERLKQEIFIAEDVVRRATIVAPQDGTVANIKVQAAGSAIIAGTPVLDIVPAGEKYLIEGKVHSMDIDAVHIGNKTEIHMTSFSDTGREPLTGKLNYVAPDSIFDEQSREAVYIVRSTVDPDSLKKHPDVFFVPGMTASLYIVSAERTALDYLLDPIKRSFSRTFREK